MTQSTSKIQALSAAGQSVWLDYIERGMVQTGELQALVDEGVMGVTSNPTIFEKAITGSDAYRADLEELVASGQEAKTIYETLAIADIQAAAGVLRPVYDATNRYDGYVSIEVAPDLAHETDATIAEARRLFATVDRPNVMVKVPATKAGIPAIRQLISEGINVNVTLIFGLERYAEVKEAYIQGLEDRLATGASIANIASVASFFVSRVDANIDAQLNQLADNGTQPDQALALRGKAAVANAKLAYAQFQEKFTGARWQTLADANAQVQRPLWASTGTKNPDYSDVLYVDTLIGPDTVNTMPPNTLEAFQDHGTIAQTVDQDVDGARADMASLQQLGISMADVTEALEVEGVEKFADSYTQLLDAIEVKRQALVVAV